MTTAAAPIVAPASPGTLPLVFLKREAAVMLLIFIFMASGSHLASLVVCLGLLIWSLRNCASVVQSLSLLVPISTLSWNFSPDEFDGRLKWIILFIAAGSAVYHSLRSYAGIRNADGRSGYSLPRWLLTFGLFIIIIGMLSVVDSRSTELSIFKLITFAVGVIAVMAAFADRRLNMAYCLSWLFTLFVMVLALSFLMLPSGRAWLPRTTYFMGILNQSQALGIYTVPFTTFLLVKWFTSQTKMTWLEITAALAGMTAIFLTNSRTSASSVVFALIMLLVLGLFRATPEHQSFRRRFLPAIFMLGLGLFILDTLTAGGFVKRFEGFVQKGGVEVTSVFATREEKFDEALEAYTKHTLTGVGFGMNLGKEEIEVKRDPYFGMPITAPVEAGVMYMAMPAQIGVIGLIPFLIFFVAFATPIARDGPLPIIGMALSALMTNAGEYTFFSVGGMGLSLWIVFAFCHRYSVLTGRAGDY